MFAARNALLGGKPGPIAFDAAGATVNTSSTTPSELHTIAGNGVLAALIVQYTGNVTAAATMTCGGQSMTQLNTTNQGYFPTPGRSWSALLFGLLNPPTGSQSLAATISSGTNLIGSQLNSLSYFNVKSFGTAGNGGSGSTPTSLSLATTATAAQLVVAALWECYSSSGGLTSFNKTSRVSTSYENYPFVMGDSSGSANPTFTATAANGDAWFGAYVPLNGF